MAYRIAVADLARDRGALVDLWSRNLSCSAEGRLRWIYADAAGGRCWLLQTDTGAVVGATGLAPRRLRIGGMEIEAGQAVDLAVDHAHRTLGPAVKLQRALLSALDGLGISLVYAFPNRASEPILMRAGYRPVGRMARWVKLLSVRRLVGERVASWAAAPALWRPVDALVAAASPERRLRWPARLEAGLVDTFDGRFDDLYARAAGQFALVGDRSAAYLAWRFERNPERRYRTMVLREGETLRGYVVFRVEAGAARIADLLADSAEAWEWLLAAYLLRARAEGLRAVSFVHLGGPLEHTLARLGFRRRAPDTAVLVHGASAALPPPSAWHLTEADRDA